MEDDDNDSVVGGRAGCAVYLGLKIMSKYMGTADLIVAADHDIVYSVELQELLDGGITESDIIQLRKQGWHVSEFDTLAQYV